MVVPLGLVVPRVAELLLLDALVAAEWDGALYVLFDGTHTPSLGDTTATVLSHLVTWPSITNPTATGWGASSIGTDSFAASVGPSLSWVFNAASGSVTVGGAAALSAAGELLGEELIPTGPVVLSTTGQVLPYQPEVSLRSAYGHGHDSA